MAEPEKNYAHAVELMEKAMQHEPDILVFPETLNVGFFPTENLQALSDVEGAKTKEVFGSFAKKHGVNIVAAVLPMLRTALFTIRLMYLTVMANAFVNTIRCTALHRQMSMNILKAARKLNYSNWTASLVRW